MAMTLRQLTERFDCRVLCGEPGDDVVISGGYACDMLSLVVSRIQPGELWLTILNSINVVAVAALADCPCVLLTESVEMEPTVLQRAADRSVVILQTPLTTFAACAEISRLLRDAP
ncbi:MAG: DRTGG domain-containing protein [Eubacteriales bacterium]|nr:DRTGG domain-containing protein [Eubacteriales bacterium]MDD3866550.1 DRTGG domain-containing protein [Eubacteriales bacterium]MDD4461025.1 DRTGG domain-containing protein [Eubacteriales bacterium]